jgi:Flp pilus assembly protein TadG
MTRVFAQLATDQRAIAAVEFALIAPVMILLICGFMEYAHVASARTTLEAATMRAARAVAASDCPTSRQEIMQSTIRGSMTSFPAAGGAGVEIETRAYSGNFSDAGEPEPFNDTNGNGRWDSGEPYNDVNGNGAYDTDMGSLGSIGGAGQVISYTSRYRVASLFNFVSMRFNGGDGYPIEASTVIRNEPVFRSTGCT